MADLGVRPEYDGDEPEAPAVTDTGRPRRAAAPTFGEIGPDIENSTPTPNPGRRGNAAKDLGDPPGEKPPSRRGGRGGARTRGGRREKAQATAPTTPVVPAKSELDLPTDTTPDASGIKDQEDPEKALEELGPRVKSGKSRAKDGIFFLDAVEGDALSKHVETGYGSLQPTSYWSVPEQRDFQRLVAHFGKDFEGISQFMKTKTPTMVSI
jgi:hypothetical protein